MKRKIAYVLTLLLAIMVLGMFVVSCGSGEEEKGLVYGYIAPTADTWYQMNIDGFILGAEADGVEVLVYYTDMDVEKELAAIESLINAGVDGFCIFSFNEMGPVAAARSAAEHNIPIVVADSVGSALGRGADIVAAIDFDWTEMGKTYARWMAENRPGEKFFIMTGTLESVPCQRVNEAMISEAEALGVNEFVGLRDYSYNPNEAVSIAQDLLESGIDFTILFIMDETAGGAVIRMLGDRGVLNNPITVIKLVSQ